MGRVSFRHSGFVIDSSFWFRHSSFRHPLSDVRYAPRIIRPTVPADTSSMSTYRNILSKLLRDERGGEVLEYALVAGLIVVAAIAVIGSVGTKVLARWNSLNSSL